MKTKTTDALQVIEPKKVPAQTQKKFALLMKIEKLEREDLAALSAEEQGQFYQFLNETLKATKGNELDFLLEKIDGITGEDSRQNNGDINYIKITGVIASFLREYGRTPSKTEIAEKTGISRKTVHKHLKEHQSSAHLEAKLEEYQLMAPNVMDKVLRSAVNGDMKAARLFLETVGKLNKLTPSPASMFINQQNNYLQINGTILSQEALQQLPPEQLKQIEEIVKGKALKP